MKPSHPARASRNWVHQNGRKLSEAHILAGQMQGTFRRWTEQGAVSEEIEMRNGQPHGRSRAYYPTGFLKAEVRLESGKVVDSKFWQDGEQKSFFLVADNLGSPARR